MAANNDLGSLKVGLQFDSSELKSSLSQIDRQMSVLSSQIKSGTSYFVSMGQTTDALKVKMTGLTDKIELQKQKIELLKVALDDSIASKGEDDKATQDLQIKYLKATESLNNMQIELNKASGELDKMDNTTKKIDFGGIVSGMKNVANVAGNVVAEVGKIAGTLTVGLATAVGVVGTKMVSMAKDSGEMADNLLTLSSQTNVSAETLQKWDYAARFIDTDVSTMTGAMAKMTKNLSTNEDSFKKLGVSIKDSSGHLKSQEDIFMASIDALGKVKNETERDALSMKLFGKSAQELNPLIKAGSEQLRALGDEAQNAGLVVSGDVLNQFGSFDDTMQRMDAKFTGLKNNITQSFMPAISSMASPIEDSIGQISAALADGFQSGDIDVIGNILTGLIDNLSKQITTIIPKIVTIIVPAINNIVSKLVTVLPTLLPMLLDGAMALLKGLLDTIKTNIKPLMDMAITMIANIASFLIDSLPLLIDVSLQVIVTLIRGLIDAMPKLIPTIIDTVLLIADTILDNLDLIINSAIDLILALALGLINAIPKLIEKIPEIIAKLVLALTDPKMLAKLIQAGITLIISLVGGIIAAIPELVAAIPRIIINFFDGLVDKIKHTDWGQLGKSILKGILDGILSIDDMIVKTVTNLKDKIVGSIKSLFGIHSPSKLMADEIGKYIPEGIAVGIETNTDSVKDSLNKVKNVAKSMDLQYQYGLGAITNSKTTTSTTYNSPINLNIEHFENNSNQDINNLMTLMEFQRKQKLSAKGGVA